MYKKYIWEEKNHSHLKLGIPAPWEFLIKKTGAWRKPAPGNQANKVLPNWENTPLSFPHAMVQKRGYGMHHAWRTRHSPHQRSPRVSKTYPSLLCEPCQGGGSLCRVRCRESSSGTAIVPLQDFWLACGKARSGSGGGHNCGYKMRVPKAPAGVARRVEAEVECRKEMREMRNANAHARRKCGEGTSVEAKSGYYTMQVSKIPECEMRGRGVRD